MPRRHVTTEAALVAAAATLVAEHGVAGMHLARIAEACGVSVGTIYNHFASKEHLLDAVADVAEREFVAAMQAAAAPDRPLRAAVPALTRGLLDVAGRSSLVRALSATPDHPSAEKRSGPIHRWITDRVASAQAAGEVGDADPATVADLAFALVRAGLPHATTKPGAQRLQPLLAAGLAALLPPPDPTGITRR